jgi:outer membrane protein assembly factor BamB
MIRTARSSLARVAAVMCAFTPPAAAQQASRDTNGFAAIFDGTTLHGWDGDPAYWRVEHGAIVGETSAAAPLKENTFLIWRGGTTRDFALTLEYRIGTRDPAGNSGVQFRSSLVPEVGRWTMKGYQADIDAADAYTGQIYEERGRGFLARPGQVVRVAPDGQVHPLGSVGKTDEVKALIKKGDWNDLRVVARGNVIVELVNGHVTSLLVDDDQRRARDGLLGLQLHAGRPMKIEFRNIRLADLDSGASDPPADWLTDGGNPQRTAWQAEETRLSTRSAKDIRLLWKITLDNTPREMHSLLPALVVGQVDTKDGPKQIVIVTGVSDNLYAIDAERGVLLWKKRFDHSAVGDTVPHSGLMCPGGITATPVVGATAVPGRYTIYAASWDGMLHQVNVADGEDVAPPAKFMPPNGKPYALNLWKNVIYTHTAQGCGGHPNVAYAYDLATRRVGSWGPAGGGMWGRTGPAISSKGVMYTGTGDGPWDPERGVYGNGIVGLQQNPTSKALELVDYFAPSNAEWLFKRDLDMQVTPAIFDYQGRELMVSAGKECRVYLMDTESIGGDDHRTPLYRTPQLCNEGFNFASAGIWGALASWVDTNGTRWILAPFWGPKHPLFKAPVEHGEVKEGAIAAFRLEQRDGGLQLTPAWVSRDMNRAEPPVVANGIVFGYASGESTTQATPEMGLRANQSEYRIKHSTHAVLYALDGQTGEELWSSGTEIASWNHWSGLSVANGRVYLGTFDGTLYCFGISP